MTTRKPGSKLFGYLLAALIAALFVLTFIPGVWRLYYYKPESETVTKFVNFYSCYDPFCMLSSILCGVSLVPLLASLTNLSRKRLTVAGVLLETAAILSVVLTIDQIAFYYLNHPGHSPLSLNPEWTVWVGVYCIGALAASALVFWLRRLSDDPAPTPVFSQRQMALYMLAIAAILALGFVDRGWKWNFSDGSSSFDRWYEGSRGILTELSLYLTVAALYMALQHMIGLVKGRPASCAALLLVAAALIIIRIVLTYVSSDTIYTDCVPLPLTYCIAAALIALGLRLLLGKRKRI